MRAMSFASAIREFCTPEGEKPTETARQLKTLNAADRAWYVAEFAKIGIEINNPIATS